MTDKYRGNKPIQVAELLDFLAQFPTNAEVVFYVDVDPSSSFYHAEELTAGPVSDQGTVDAWVHLTAR